MKQRVASIRRRSESRASPSDGSRSLSTSTKTASSRESIPDSAGEQDRAPDCIGNRRDALPCAGIGHDDRLAGTDRAGLIPHGIKAAANIGRKADLIDDQQVPSQHAGPTLPRDVAPAPTPESKNPPA